MNRAILLTTILMTAFVMRLGYDLFHPGASPMLIAKPLGEAPADLFGTDWRVEEIELREDVEERAGVDDYLSRVYTRDEDHISFYVGYVSGFKPGAVHNPDLCNPGSGYTLVRKDIVDIPAPEGTPKLAFNEYVWRDPRTGAHLFTLSSFCYNGKFEPSELALRANGWRANYFSVMTIQGSFIGTEENTRKSYYDLVRKSVPVILEHFPK